MQLHSLSEMLLKAWATALLPVCSDVAECLLDIGKMATAAVQFASDPTVTVHVPFKAHDALAAATATLRGTADSYRSMLDGAKSFLKDGTVLGAFAKTQRAKGMTAPWPKGPLPSFNSRRLDAIVGGSIIPFGDRHPDLVAPTPVTDFLKRSKPESSAFGGEKPGGGGYGVRGSGKPRTAAGRSAHEDGGALFRWLSEWARANGVTFGTGCYGCQVFGRSAGSHSVADCMYWSEYKTFSLDNPDPSYGPPVPSNLRGERHAERRPRSPDREDRARDLRVPRSYGSRFDSGRGESGSYGRGDGRGRR